MERESFQQVEALVRLFRERQLQELRIEDGSFKLHLSRRRPQSASVEATPRPRPSQAPAAAPLAREQGPPTTRRGKGRTVAIRSPLIGVFYRGPSPETAPFVTLGEVVSEGQTVCIVEAMKVFNEIKAEWNGRVIAIPVQDGDLVQAGDPLIVLEFADGRMEEEG